MISKTYNTRLITQSATPDGQRVYYPTNKNKNIINPITRQANGLWVNGLRDGIIDGNLIAKNQRLTMLDSGGTIDIMDSYIDIDGVEFYCLPYKKENIASAYVYRRLNGNRYIEKILSVENTTMPIIKSNPISHRNIRGSKENPCTHSEIKNHLSTLAINMDVYEELEPFYINQSKFVITTDYYPIMRQHKAFGYNQIAEEWVDLDSHVYKIIRHTGEIVFDISNITSVKIFYFVAPAVIVGNEHINGPVNPGQFLEVAKNNNVAHIKYDINKYHIDLDTNETEDIVIDFDTQTAIVKTDKNVIINGVRSTSSGEVSKCTIAASHNVYDNIRETTDFSIPIVCENINVAILGLFDNGASKRLSVMSVGIEAMDPGYLTMITTVGAELFGTILHTTSGALPPETNGNLSYVVQHSINDNGYSLALPAWANAGTINVYEIDGVDTNPFYDYTYIEPDIIILDSKKAKPDNVYEIHFSSFVSPILSYVNTYEHKAYINTIGDIYTAYPTLQAIYTLSDDKTTLLFSDRRDAHNETYFENSTEISINITQKYIKASLDYYKSRIFGTI